ncbi:MAG: folate-binding protein [Opitutaceae bacterium]|nr:folate-binding protein [Opitutaceae bacterium]
MPITFSTLGGFFEWSPAAWLRVTGPDALLFLQGQFSQDLRMLAVAAAGAEPAYGLWLTLKGKVEADGFVFRGEGADEFWIGSYFSRASVIRARLEGFIIADDVTIEDQTGAWAGITWVGEVPAAPPGVFAFTGRRGFPVSRDWVYRREPRAGRAGARLEAETVERARIAARMPAVPADAGPGDLPNEAGLDADAVSYTKGCYLGQEVMARLKAMGQVRRRLVRVTGTGSSPIALPAAVFAGERQVGEVRSAIADGAGGWLGLAMVSNLHVKADSELAFSAIGPASLRLLDAP